MHERDGGSCSHQGNLSFTWRLIMAPLLIIDSVVVHELVHLEVKNHSKAFWNKVGSLDPEYKEHKDWLKNNGFPLPASKTIILQGFHACIFY